jgi:hypothetical protein
MYCATIRPILISILVLFSVSYGYCDIIYRCDFEDGECRNFIEYQWEGVWSNYGNDISISSSYPNSGSHSLKIHRSDFDCSVYSGETYNACAHVTIAVNGTQTTQERWIGYTMYIPENEWGEMDPNNYITIEDFHQASGCSDIGWGFVQMVAFFYHHTMGNVDTAVAGGETCTTWPPTYIKEDTIPIHYGRNNIVMNVKFTIDGTGFVYYYLDGQLVFSDSGHINTWPNGQGLIMGIYTTSQPSSKTYYIDDIVIGDENSSFEEVSPAGGGSVLDLIAPTLGTPYVKVGSTTYYITVPSGTQSVVVHQPTDEAGTMKYATSSGVAFGSMSAVDGNDGLDYYVTRSGLSDGNTYTTCFKEQDAATNESNESCIDITVDSSGGGGTNLHTDLSYVSAAGAMAPDDAGGWCVGQLLHDGQVDGNNFPYSVCNSWENAETITSIYNWQTEKDLTLLRFYGTDADGGWGCTTYDYYVTANGTDYTEIFSGRDCSSVGWDEVDLTAYGATVQGIVGDKTVIHGYEAGGGTQAQEETVFGIDSEEEEEPLPPPTNLSGGLVTGLSMSPNMISGFAGAVNAVGR